MPQLIGDLSEIRGKTMTAHERIERQAFVRWMRKVHPNVTTRRYGQPARDQYLVPSVQEAWQGWFARSFRYTQSELTRAAKRGQKLAAEWKDQG